MKSVIPNPKFPHSNSNSNSNTAFVKSLLDTKAKSYACDAFFCLHLLCPSFQFAGLGASIASSSPVLLSTLRSATTGSHPFSTEAFFSHSDALASSAYFNRLQRATERQQLSYHSAISIRC
jgi:hypothetical protein